MSDELGGFFMLERQDEQGATRYYVVHRGNPRFGIELMPDRDAADGVGRGVVRHLSLPNSWSGQYSQYGRWVTLAQEFFRRSFWQLPGSSPRFSQKG